MLELAVVLETGTTPTTAAVVVRSQDRRGGRAHRDHPSIIVEMHAARAYATMISITPVMDIMGRGSVAPKTIVRPAPAIAPPRARTML